jgi:hypothetical protein
MRAPDRLVEPRGLSITGQVPLLVSFVAGFAGTLRTWAP